MSMERKPTFEGMTTPCDSVVGDGCSGSRVSGVSGGTDITPNTFEMLEHFQTDSLSSCAPLSKDQQYIRSVAHVGFTKALLAQKPSPWTMPMFKLYCYLFIAFLNSCINGYDGSLMGGINAMSTYQKFVLIVTFHFAGGVTIMIANYS